MVLANLTGGRAADRVSGVIIFGRVARVARVAAAASAPRYRPDGRQSDPNAPSRTSPKDVI